MKITILTILMLFLQAPSIAAVAVESNPYGMTIPFKSNIVVDTLTRKSTSGFKPRTNNYAPKLVLGLGIQSFVLMLLFIIGLYLESLPILLYSLIPLLSIASFIATLIIGYNFLNKSKNNSKLKKERTQIKIGLILAFLTLSPIVIFILILLLDALLLI